MGDEPNNVTEEAVAEPEVQLASERSPAESASLPEAAAVDAAGADQPTPVSQPEEAAAEASGDEPSCADAECDIPAEETPVDEAAEAVGEVEPVATEETDEPVAEEPVVASDAQADESNGMDWYILKVQSNRERSIAEALRRKIAIEGLEEFFGDVVVPTEKVTEFKGGKKKVVERKLYPGYIVVNMCINDDTWFAVRETSGIGDFTGSGGKPTPMLSHEVARIIHKEEEEQDEAPKLNIRFKIEDRVKIKEGTFEGFEGDVNDIDEASGRVTVMINIFGRSTPVEMEYWQIETV